MDTSLPPFAVATSRDVGELFRAAANGDQPAWTALVERYSVLVRSVPRAFRLADEDVADVAQNTWLRLATHITTIRTPEALPGWLVTTARRETLSLLKGRRE